MSKPIPLLTFAGAAALAVGALMPFAVQAAAIVWTGGTDNTWTASGNWSPAGPPSTTSAVTIGNTTNSPVQITGAVSLNGTTGSLTIGTGVGSTESVNITSTGSLNMGTRPITLSGGSITGLGTLSSTGTIQGYGTISAPITGTSFSANSTDGTNFGGFSPFVNGTPGTPITLSGQNNLTNDSFTVSNHGDFNFQGVTLTTPTLNGVSTNLNAGSIGGNNYYGLLSFSGAASTVVGNINNTNYEQFDINGTTLNLQGVTLTNSWATNAPPFWVINSGGVLNNQSGNSNLTGHMAVVMNGGSITNTGGSTFTAPGLITGYGSISGPMTINGGLTATGGTLTVDGTAGTGITIGATGWGSSSGSVLDMKGTFNYPTTGGFLNPGGGTIQFDGATLNNAGHTIYTGAGSIVANSGVNTLNTAMIPNGSNGSVPNYTVNNGATLNVNNTNALNAAIYANNFTMQNNSKLTDAGANTTFNLAGNFSFQQTDPVNAWTYGSTAGLGPDLNMNGGTSSTPATQNLEVGGVNQGYTPAGFVDNFALDRLTIGQNTTVDLVDQYPNATPSGWTSGEEAVYLDALYGGPTNEPIPVLDENGLDVFLQGYGLLPNGIYTAPDGTEVNVIGAPVTAPAPLIGRGVPVLLAVGGFLFGVRLFERGKKLFGWPGAAGRYAA